MSAPLIRLGLQIPVFTFPGVDDAGLFDRVVEMSTAAEQSGFDSVFVMDHFHQLAMTGPTKPMFDAYTLLGGVAAATSTVRLGAMVGGVTYRNPAHLAKIVTTLDVMSKGRAIWGIGAGWYEAEHRGYGWEFGTYTERFEKLEETIRIVTAMFTEESTSFAGKWFRTDGALNFPKPVQPGGPPVLIGGTGRNKTLRMVAQYGDACNFLPKPNAETRELFEVLDRHCERLGRDPSTICRTRTGALALGRTKEDATRMVARRYGADRWEDLSPAAQEAAEVGVVFGDAPMVQQKVHDLHAAGFDGLVFSTLDLSGADSVREIGELLRSM